MSIDDTCAGSSDSQSQYGTHIRRGASFLLIGYGVVVLVGIVWVPLYALWAAWFGAVYLAAALLGVISLGALATRRAGTLTWGAFMAWFALESVAGVCLSTLFAAVVVPLYSDTDTSQLMGIQSAHSAVFLVAGLLAALTWRVASELKARRRPREGSAPATGRGRRRWPAPTTGQVLGHLDAPAPGGQWTRSSTRLVMSSTP